MTRKSSLVVALLAFLSFFLLSARPSTAQIVTQTPHVVSGGNTATLQIQQNAVRATANGYGSASTTVSSPSAYLGAILYIDDVVVWSNNPPKRPGIELSYDANHPTFWDYDISYALSNLAPGTHTAHWVGGAQGEPEVTSSSVDWDLTLAFTVL